MAKKILLVTLVVFAIILSSSYIYAANLGNTVKDSVNKATNAVQNTGNTIKNTTSNLITPITGTINNTVNSGAGAITGDTTGVTPRTTADITPYTAERTNTTARTNWMGLNNTAWTWIIMGITAIIICSTVWYYGNQYERKNVED